MKIYKKTYPLKKIYGNRWYTKVTFHDCFAFTFCILRFLLYTRGPSKQAIYWPCKHLDRQQFSRMAPQHVHDVKRTIVVKHGIRRDKVRSYFTLTISKHPIHTLPFYVHCAHIIFIPASHCFMLESQATC